MQTIFSVGSLIGLLGMNILADTKGRRVSIMCSLGGVIVGVLCNWCLLLSVTVFSGLLNNIWLLGMGQMCLGFGGYSLFVLSYILLGDFCVDTLRQKGIIILNASWGIGIVLLGLFYLHRLNWNSLLIFYILLPILLLLIIIYLYVEESPYILMLHHRKLECINMMHRLANYNGFTNNHN